MIAHQRGNAKRQVRGKWFGSRSTKTGKPEIKLTTHANLRRARPQNHVNQNHRGLHDELNHEAGNVTPPPQQARDSTKKKTSKLGFPKPRFQINPSTHSVHQIKPHNSSTETSRRHQAQAITNDHARPIQTPQGIKLASCFDSALQANGIGPRRKQEHTWRRRSQAPQ